MDAQLSHPTSGLSYEEIHCFNAWRAKALLDDLIENDVDKTPLGFITVNVIDHAIGLETRCAQLTTQTRITGAEINNLHEVIDLKEAEVKNLKDYIQGKRAQDASTWCLCCPQEVSETTPDSKGNPRTVNYCELHFAEKSAEYQRRIEDRLSGGNPITCMCCQEKPANSPTAWYCKSCFSKVNAGVRPVEAGFARCFGYNNQGCLHGINGVKKEDMLLCSKCHAYGKKVNPEMVAVKPLLPGWAICLGFKKSCTRQTDLTWGELCKDCNVLAKKEKFAPKPVAVQHQLCELCGVQVPPGIKAVHDAGTKHQDLLNPNRTKASAKPAKKLLKK